MKTLMKRLLLILSSLMSMNVHAVTLDGTWKSDSESTLAFNDANAKLTEKQRKFISELLGKLTITYKDEVVHSSMPSAKVTVKGELKDFQGFNKSEKYRILAKDKDTIVLEAIESDGTKEIALLKFETEDKYWIYLPNSSSPWSQHHIREYFVRQK